MSEPNRPTMDVVYLIDVDDEEPRPGSNVYALGLGGKLVETTWKIDSRKFYKAWMPYPKVPKAVKEKLYDLYLNGGWRLNGNGPEGRCESGN